MPYSGSGPCMFGEAVCWRKCVTGYPAFRMLSNPSSWSTWRPDIQLWSPSPYMNRRFKLYLCENWRLIRKILFTEWLSHYFQGDMAPISSWFKISSCLIYCPLKHFFLLKKEMSRKSAFRCPHNYMERKWDSQKPLHFKKTPFPKRSIFKCLYWLTPQPVDQAGEAHRFFEETC